MMRSFTHIALVICLVAGASQASAHDARPLSIDIAEQTSGVYLARLRTPPTVAPDNRPEILWPDGCATLRHERRNDSDIEAMLIRCKSGLAGQRLGVRYPIYNPSLATLFRLHARDGRILTQVLTPAQQEWQVPREPTWREVATGYLRLGVEHIWTGVDHLLFVAGLLVLAGTTRRVILAITGFTIAHSMTLSLSALGWVHAPTAPIEAAIALSILFLARELAQPFDDGVARRFPIFASSAFGLLHGFGFAAALRDVGLPTNELALGLLCFNLGVELGQIVFIGAAFVVFLIGRRIVQSLESTPRIFARPAALAGYGLGVPAAFWFMQRLGAF